jgi:hypothetical protein
LPKIYKGLCSNPTTIGTIIYDTFNIYLFTKNKLYVFDSKSTIEPGSEDLETKFLDMISDNIVPSKRWLGFEPNDGRFFAHNNDLCNIIDNKKYTCWGVDGNEYATDQPIEEPEEELPDEPDGDYKDAGALINGDGNDKSFSFIQIRGDRVCDIIIENKKLFTIGKCKSIDEEEHKFPADIIAAIKTKNNNFYFISKDGTYCKRAEKTYGKVIRILK